MASYVQKYDLAVHAVIAKLTNLGCSNEGRTLVSIKNNPVRIDRQGTYTKEDKSRWANIQVQLNIQRHGRKSTTVAAVQVELEPLKIRYVRNALLRSYHNHQEYILCKDWVNPDSA